MPPNRPGRSTSSASAAVLAPSVLGSVEPRIWTPPLRPLTPDTSYGFDAIEFAQRLRRPLDPWQEWVAIHGGELLPDGRPRFRIVIVLVARQNGKTELLVILTLFWQFVDAVPMILGTSTKLDYAHESWTKACKLAEKATLFDPSIAELVGDVRKWKRKANGEQESWTTEESRYKIAASNEEGGRSLTINRLVLDELRQHHDYSAYDAAEPACSPMDAQIWAISNAGSDKSVVLNNLRADALEFITTGQGDPRIGLFEYSAPEDADPTDIHALAMANPNMGRRLDGEVLRAKGERAKKAGFEALAGFKTENMCIRVVVSDPAVDPSSWKHCHVPGTLDDARDRIAMCIDVAPDQRHATLYAAAMIAPNLVRLDFVRAWEGPKCTEQLRRALPGVIEQVRPRVLGWFPNGPAAAIAADLLKPKDARAARRRARQLKVDTQEIRSEIAAVCMGFAEQVTAEAVAHSNDPLLTTQVLAAEKLKRGDTWVFMRSGDGHVDAVYAAAGAAHLARTMPAPRRVRVISGQAGA